MSQVVEFRNIAGEPGAPIGLIEDIGLSAQTTEITDGASVSTRTLEANTRYLEIIADDVDIRINIGPTSAANPTATAGYLINANTSKGFIVPYPRNTATWRVAIINKS